MTRRANGDALKKCVLVTDRRSITLHFENPVVEVEVFHVRPKSDVQNWEPGLKAALRNTPAVAVILREEVSQEILATIAQVIALSDAVGLVAAWGSASETLHDLVDRMMLERREVGPVTTFENDCGVEHFIWAFALVYRGVLNVEDQDRRSLVCHVSDGPIPENVLGAIERMRNRTIQPAND
jgi:hypothetical protein